MACVGAPDVASVLLDSAEGGAYGELDGLISDRSEGRQAVQVGVEETVSASTLAERMEAGAGVWSDDGWDVVVLSGYADVVEVSGLDRDGYRAAIGRAIGVSKERLGAHVVAFNMATGDPDGHQHTFVDGEEPFLIRAHKLNLALIELSYAHGISVIDVDRVVAELGAAAHVLGRASYSAEAIVAIQEEFVRVLGDIGFFESRPLLMQVGNPEQG